MLHQATKTKEGVRFAQGMTQLGTYNHSIPLDLMNDGLLFNDFALSFESTLLLAEAALKDSVCGEHLIIFSKVHENGENPYHIEFLQLYYICFPRCTMPYQHI